MTSMVDISSWPLWSRKGPCSQVDSAKDICWKGKGCAACGLIFHMFQVEGHVAPSVLLPALQIYTYPYVGIDSR